MKKILLIIIGLLVASSSYAQLVQHNSTGFKFTANLLNNTDSLFVFGRKGAPPIMYAIMEDWTLLRPRFVFQQNTGGSAQGKITMYPNYGNEGASIHTADGFKMFLGTVPYGQARILGGHDKSTILALDGTQGYSTTGYDSTLYVRGGGHFEQGVQVDGITNASGGVVISSLATSDTNTVLGIDAGGNIVARSDDAGSAVDTSKLAGLNRDNQTVKGNTHFADGLTVSYAGSATLADFIPYYGTRGSFTLYSPDDNWNLTLRANSGNSGGYLFHNSGVLNVQSNRFGTSTFKAGGSSIDIAPDSTLQAGDAAAKGGLHVFGGGKFEGTVTSKGSTVTEVATIDSLVIGDGSIRSKDTSASITASGAGYSMPINLIPKGQGGFYLGPKADGTSTGGNARGAFSTDLQTNRDASTKIASGTNSFAAGANNTSSNTGAVAIGSGNVSSGVASVSVGADNTASNSYSVALGRSNSSSGNSSLAGGAFSSATKDQSFAWGGTVTASAAASVAFGELTTAKRVGEFAIGLSTVTQRSQYSTMTLRDTTGNAVQDTMQIRFESDSSGLSTRIWTVDNSIKIDSGQAITYLILITARSQAGDVGSYKIEGALKRIATTTSMVGMPTVTTLAEDAAMSSASVTVVADDTNDALFILVTGIPDAIIRWTAVAQLNMVGF